jgi:hypothetical protein
MIGVLLDGADPGQARPRLREAANLAAHGICMLAHFYMAYRIRPRPSRR